MLVLKINYTKHLDRAGKSVRYHGFRTREMAHDMKGMFSKDRDSADIGKFIRSLDDPLTQPRQTRRGEIQYAVMHRLMFSLSRKEFEDCGLTSWQPVIREAATLAAWDGADNRFALPVTSEADIFDQLVAAEEARRQRKADKECEALPPGSPCPDPEPLSEADLQRFRQKGHRDWYTLVLNHIRSRAARIRDTDQADPESFFDRVLARAKAQHAAELQVAYTILDQLGEDDHAIADPPDPPAAWVPVDGFAWPATGEITSRFGMRSSPIDGKRRLHAGIDLAIAQGTRVGSSKAGTVVRANSDPTYGLVVVVDHGVGYETLYAHNSVLEVALGAHVEQGQELSLSGTTGASTGPHLHFEVHYQGTPVDPMLLLGR